MFLRYRKTHYIISFVCTRLLCRTLIAQVKFSHWDLDIRVCDPILHIETDVLRIIILRVIQVLNSEKVSNKNNSRNKNLMFDT